MLRFQVYDPFFPLDRGRFQCPHFGEQVLQLQFRLRIAGIDPVELLMPLDLVAGGTR